MGPPAVGQHTGRVGGTLLSRSRGEGQGCASAGVSSMWVGRKLGLQTLQHSRLSFSQLFHYWLGFHAKIKNSVYVQRLSKPEKLRRRSLHLA